MIDAAWVRIERAGAAGRTLTLKVKFADFSIISRAQTRAVPITTRADVAEIGRAILLRLLPVETGIRLLGLTLSAFDARASETTEQPTFEL